MKNNLSNAAFGFAFAWLLHGVLGNQWTPLRINIDLISRPLLHIFPRIHGRAYCDAVKIEKYVVYLLLIMLPVGTHHMAVLVHNYCTSPNIKLAQARTILEMDVMKADDPVVS